MKKISLKYKLSIAIIIITLILSMTSIVISYGIYSARMNEHYKRNAMNIAKAAASLMEGDKIAVYIQQLEALDKQSRDYDKEIQAIKDDSYYVMLNKLFELKDNLDAMYLYVEKITPKNGVYIMDADTGGSACELGDTYPVAGDNYKYLDSLEGIPAFITNTKEFGWLCSAGAPIYDSKGTVVAFAFADISMKKVVDDKCKFLVLISIILILKAIMITMVTIYITNKNVVFPINSLAIAASKFVWDKSKISMGTAKESAISKLSIHTGDEIENLCRSIQTMEKEINNYIDDLTAVTAEKERICTELNVANQIRVCMLPNLFPAFPEREEFDIFALTQPWRGGGGDFYDFFLVDRDHLAVIVADVTGDGIPATLFMVIAKTLIKNHMQTGIPPQEVFTLVNAQLCENNYAKIFITAWMGVLEISTGRFIYVNAGHNFPLLKREDGCYEYIPSRAGFVLAGMEEISYLQYEMQLQPGDELFLYTEGVIKATNMKHEIYGEYRLQEVLNRNRNTSPFILLSSVKEDLDDFTKNAYQSHDITMLALKIRGSN